MTLTFYGPFTEARLERLARALVERVAAAASVPIAREEIFDTTDFQGAEKPITDEVIFAADGVGVRIVHDRLHGIVTVTAPDRDGAIVRTLAFEALWSISREEGEALLAWQAMSGMTNWSNGASGASSDLLEGSTADCGPIEHIAAARAEHDGITFAAAVCAARRGDHDRALATFDAIAKRSPRFYAARLAAVWMVQRRNDHESALARLDTFDPYERHTHWHRARFESEWALERWADALRTVDAWVKLSAGAEGFPLFDDEADVLRAALLSRLGDHDAAAEARARARKLAERIAKNEDLGRRDAWVARFARFGD